MTRLQKYEAILRDLNCWLTQRKTKAYRKMRVAGISEDYWLGAEATADMLQQILQDRLQEIKRSSVLDCAKCAAVMEAQACSTPQTTT